MKQIILLSLCVIMLSGCKTAIIRKSYIYKTKDITNAILPCYNNSDGRYFASSLLAIDIESFSVNGKEIFPEEINASIQYDNDTRIIHTDATFFYTLCLRNCGLGNEEILFRAVGIKKIIGDEVIYFRPTKLYAYKFPKNFDNIKIIYRVRFPNGDRSEEMTAEFFKKYDKSKLVKEIITPVDAHRSK